MQNASIDYNEETHNDLSLSVHYRKFEVRFQHAPGRLMARSFPRSH
jgi:hypothetical protein